MKPKLKLMLDGSARRVNAGRLVRLSTDPVRRSFALRLQEQRISAGYTVVAFSEIGGVQKQTQLAYERGDSVPNADYLRKLHEASAIDVLYLVTGRTTASQEAA